LYHALIFENLVVYVYIVLQYIFDVAMLRRRYNTLFYSFFVRVVFVNISRSAFWTLS